MRRNHVVATCEKRKVSISSIEPLHPTGTRVVMNNAADAAVIVKAYGSKVLGGPVTRTPIRPRGH